ncbi:hypothetical protein [Robinsoniella peoriensis]|uniref:hypothetical protein n=1 Tax=Robinsoniella peoriensis TaxID=180332 RepID=UPI001FA7CAAB|nr:hypothetical protein [Robinsoniella peoriensis]
MTGAGRLIGPDNGDSPDFDQHKGISRRLFGGKLLAVIAAKTEPGEIHVTLESEVTGKADYYFKAVSCGEIPEGVSALMENEERVLIGAGSGMSVLQDGKKEVPIRKIELSVEGTDCLNKENPFVMIRAHIYPENATYQDISWKTTNESGIEIDHAKLDAVEGGIRLNAKGDGEIRVRCSACNGGSVASVISELTFHAAGIGQVYMNPYKEIPAGLGDIRRANALGSMEHGISFAGEGTVGYSYIDFGANGADELTVSIFANTDDAVSFKVWEEDPKLGGEPLLDAVYHVKHEWMEFKDMTYRLPKRLTGKRSLYFTSNDNINFKSFVFTEANKAFSTLLASECSSVYGDKFVYNGTCIEKIGNNVLLEYAEMDFGEPGAECVTICGSSPLEKSSIQLRFIHEDKTDVQMIEFAGSEVYCEQTCPLEKVYGKCKVAVVFLPGSNFNLASICFH